MDFKDLSYDELIAAMELTPSLAILNGLSDEIGRFSQQEQKELREVYERNYAQFVRPMGKVYVGIGQLMLYWLGKVPYSSPFTSITLKEGYVKTWHIDNLIEWVKKNLPNATDIILLSREAKLRGYESVPTAPVSLPSKEEAPYVGEKLRKAVENFVPLPSLDEIERIRKQDEEEIEREKQIDEAIRKKKVVPQDVIKDVVSEAKEEVRGIKRILRTSIPPEIHNLYMRYIGVKPNYVNQRAFALFLRRVMTAFPNWEVQEILDRVDFGPVIEAIKRGQKYGEYLQEAFNDLLKRLNKTETNVEANVELVDELNLRIEIFKRLLDLLFRIYAEYGREGDKDVQRAILRVLCENFDICSEAAIENVRKDISGWVIDHIDYLG